MSQALSPSFARCYGLARVARVRKISRAGVYRSLKETQPNTSARRPGPSTRGRSKLDRRPSRRQRISISRRSRDGARRGDLRHIPERIPLEAQFAVNVIGRVAFDPKSTQSGKLYPQGSNCLTGIRTPVRASSVPSSRERRSAALQGITTIKSVSFPVSVLNS